MITIANFGKHEDVLTAVFGTGDIRFTRATWAENEPSSLLVFYNQAPAKEIGEIDNEMNGMSTNDLPKPELVFSFTRPESITALIHSLVELQKEVFKLNK